MFLLGCRGGRGDSVGVGVPDGWLRVCRSVAFFPSCISWAGPPRFCLPDVTSWAGGERQGPAVSSRFSGRPEPRALCLACGALCTLSTVPGWSLVAPHRPLFHFSLHLGSQSPDGVLLLERQTVLFLFLPSSEHVTAVHF